jgi:regulator of replication initiation timing
MKLIDIFWSYGKTDMNLIKELRNEIYMLKLENKHLKLRLEEVNSNWVHPKSCLHNEDPWKKFLM